MSYLGTFTEVGTVSTASLQDDAVTTDKLANTINTDIATGVAGKTTADTAVTNAASAQTTANTAVTNAATAQTTANAALPKAGGAMTGAITTNSTFDGRDVATDGTKLDGIAISANNYSLPVAEQTVFGGVKIYESAGVLYISTS
jgi:hypothetical protein